MTGAREREVNCLAHRLLDTRRGPGVKRADARAGYGAVIGQVTSPTTNKFVLIKFVLEAAAASVEHTTGKSHIGPVWIHGLELV